MIIWSESRFCAVDQVNVPPRLSPGVVFVWLRVTDGGPACWPMIARLSRDGLRDVCGSTRSVWERDNAGFGVEGGEW